jgi:heme-degrading monooxygenase HmoA
MYARLTVLEGDPERADELPEAYEGPLPEDMPGLRALYCLIDRATGRAAAISIWESREAMDAAERRGDEQRRLAERNSGGRILSVDRMEVVNALDRGAAV